MLILRYETYAAAATGAGAFFCSASISHTTSPFGIQKGSLCRIGCAFFAPGTADAVRSISSSTLCHNTTSKATYQPSPN
jgi:hypothetical protein